MTYNGQQNDILLETEDYANLNLCNVSSCAAKGGGSPEREGGAGEKHGPPAAGEGAAGGREGGSAEGV